MSACIAARDIDWCAICGMTAEQRVGSGEECGGHPGLFERYRNAQAKLSEARAVLREVEWCADNACPVCFLYEDSTDGHGRGPGHASDCRLKKALGES